MTIQTFTMKNHALPKGAIKYYKAPGYIEECSSREETERV